MKHFSYIIFALVFAIPLRAQNTELFGKLTDDAGEPLGFASIYVTGTSVGTTTNMDGEYTIKLTAGTYEFAFQYIGYETEKRTVVITDQPVELNVVLQSGATNLREIVVTSGEDPAYAIIRKAIRKRKYYQKQFREYSCNAYMKGTQTVENLPETFMGQSLSDLREGLDSNGTGIVYLSESLSELYYQDGEFKEVMTSSKVSGNDNGFSFNSSAAMAEMSFYENSFELAGSSLMSPIASGAMASYDYRLKSTFEDNEGRVINEIKVIPKNEAGPYFQGIIYIVDKDWAIYGTNLFTTGKAANITILDTLTFKQTHVNLGQDKWRIFSQEINFNIKLLFINTKGKFIGVFTDYNLEPKFDKNFFNAEIFKVQEDANDRLAAYWDSIRPVALSKKEEVDYVIKDSIAALQKTKAYKDSVDKVSNTPGLLNLLTGYTYTNTYKNYSIRILSPLDKLTFSSVQGQLLGLGAEFFKGLDENKYKWYRIHGEGEYALEDKQFRGMGFFQVMFNAKSYNFLHLEGGRQLRQFQLSQPINMLFNTYYTLLLRQNYGKFYDEVYGRVYYSQHIVNGLFFKGEVKYSQRSAVTNVTDFSWFGNKDKPFFSNNPQDLSRPPMVDDPSFVTNDMLQFTAALRIRIGQKYITYPERKFYTQGEGPDIWLRYQKGFSVMQGNANYDYLELKLEKKDVALGLAGFFSYNLKGGIFINPAKNTYFTDYHHFTGNQTIFAGDFMNSYQLLPYYEYSTNTYFAEVHLQHDFNGYIWNKLPGLKKLGFEFVTGAHFLYTPEQLPYAEFNIGIDRIGWKLFRFLRADFVMGYRPNERLRLGGVLTLQFSL